MFWPLQNLNQPLVFHSISGSFWMTLYIMEYLGRDWCEENLRAIVFDSCPPMSDIYGMDGKGAGQDFFS